MVAWDASDRYVITAVNDFTVRIFKDINFVLTNEHIL